MEQALVLAERTKWDLLNYTKGVVLFGTPAFRDVEEWLTFIHQVHDEPCESIGKSRFEKVVKLNIEFERLISWYSLRMAFIYEELPAYQDSIVCSVSPTNVNVY